MIDLFSFFRKKPKPPKIFGPTGQSYEEVLAIQKRAETETDKQRIKRLGADKITKSKWTSINCPLCDVAISYVAGDLTESEPYPYHDRLKLVGQGDCPFCKTRISFTHKEGGDIRARDTNWDKIKSKFYNDETKISDDLADLEEELEETEEKVKREKIKSKIKLLEAKQQAISDRFEEREIAYNERQERYREKAQLKFDTEL